MTLEFSCQIPSEEKKSHSHGGSFKQLSTQTLSYLADNGARGDITHPVIELFVLKKS